VVHAGKAEILKGQEAKPLHGFVDPDLAILDLFQQLSQVLWLNDRVLDLQFAIYDLRFGLTPVAAVLFQPLALGSKVSGAKSPALYM